MTLQDWREGEGLTRAALAEKIGGTAESVRRYEKGLRVPDRETMPLIVEVTSGAVTPNDFFGIGLAVA